MTSQELETTYNEFAKLAEELRTVANKDGGDQLHRILAGTGYLLSNIGKMVAEIKGQVDEVTYRERNHDRTSTSLRDERAIVYFAKLKTEEREHLVRAIELGPPNISIKAFAEQISGRLNMSSWRIKDILEWIGSWYNFLAQRETEDDVNTAASYLIDPYGVESSTKEILVAVDAANPTSAFTQQLKRLLRCHSTLGVTYKAEMLVRRNERQYSYAAVSTDVRPIFSGNVETAPSYGVVIHNLVIDINDGGISRSIGFALTSADILTLAETFNRAYKKEQTLRKHAPYKILPLG